MPLATKEEIQILEKTAQELRRDTLDLIYKTKSPHIGCSLSMIELLTALYFRILRINSESPRDENRDRFLLSKGHGVPALYPFLAKKGFIKKEIFDGYAQDGGTLEQHPTRNIDLGIEITSGSLGHGLSIGSGMALAGKHDKKDYRVFVYLGDGELQEGSNWEAAMFASHHKLDNLVAIIDHNKLQAMQRIEEVLDLNPLADKWRAFGWETKEVNGHDLNEIVSVMNKIPFKKGKPSCVIAHTVKGKGISFMENEPRWHDRCPDENEYQQALNELKGLC
ncbi:MAG: transketolase [Candidatus Pacebacteria bacterium]|nr:transketolase [Candidatus Paceibacterota bacterium]